MPAFGGLSPLSSSTSACVVPTIEEHETTYQYEPIVADEELRVLLLEPGVFEEPLVGSLLVRKIGELTYRDFDWVPQGDGNEWDCVSYCWGPQKDYTYFSCDGRPLRITTTVEDMLKHLRELFIPRYLWIDAICINQADNTEKSLQVLSMGKIYSIASNVVVWLGPATDQDRIDDLLPIFDDPDVEEHAFGVPAMPIDSVSFAFPSLDAFFSRGWFKRRWILQEVVLSRELTVQCGRLEFTWQSLKHSADVRLDHEDNFHWSAGTQEAAKQITMLDGQTNHRRTILKYAHLSNSESGLIYSRILQLLSDFDAAQCADERDRLYSLYGMSPKSYEQCPVNYGAHFSRTYTDFARAAIMKGLGHRVLHQAITFGNLSQQDKSWPSWVPSWNTLKKMPDLGRYGQHAFRLDTSDELIFGLAFVRVEPGDLVFRRNTTSDPGLVAEPVCALVIRPYRSSSSPRQDLFRLVGVCVDSYALMHGAGPKYEERDIVLV
ncbi:unnamed protein product [Alternaria alternata]